MKINYSETEREFYAVLWAVTKLRPEIEGMSLTVRTGQNSIKWPLSRTELFGRLTR